jgi:hypothetical protein
MSNSTPYNADPPIAGSGNTTPTTPTNRATFENSTWETVAMEDTTRALQRLMTLAKDLYKKDPSKTVSQHYSERLAILLSEAEIEFDPKCLH